VNEPRYKIGTVAKLTGLSPFLLRAWENRYDLLKPHRSETGRRVYSQSDVETLRAVKRLLTRGYSIGEVASWSPEQIRATDEAKEDRSPLHNGLEAPGSREPTLGGGDLFRGAREELLSAATTFDRGAFDATLANLSVAAPFGEIISDVFVPLLREIGERWARGDLSVASEHFVTNALRQRLVAMLQATAGADGPRALVACAPGDYHEMGALFTCYDLARQGWAVTFLGASLPAEEFAQAIGRTRPKLVGLSVILGVEADALAEWLRTIGAACPPGTRKLCGGAGARAYGEVVATHGFEVEE
jgi:DNA-binding transcriptional MerR regulator/methylmalonyl-CoA mutase cobalamin-binding subunit